MNKTNISNFSIEEIKEELKKRALIELEKDLLEFCRGYNEIRLDCSPRHTELTYKLCKEKQLKVDESKIFPWGTDEYYIGIDNISIEKEDLIYSFLNKYFIFKERTDDLFEIYVLKKTFNWKKIKPKKDENRTCIHIYNGR